MLESDVMAGLIALVGRGIWISLALLALSSCGDDTAAPGRGSATLNVAAAPLASIAVTPANPSVATGMTQQFTATGTYTDGTQAVLTSQATWASATPAVATISASGLASAVATGSSGITATFGGVTATAASLTVTAAPRVVKSIQVTPSYPTVPAGITQAFKAVGTFTDNSTADITADVTWATATPAVATVTGSGVATALSAGTSNITATCATATVCQALSGSATLNVTAAALVSIAVTPGSSSVAKGMGQQFTATGTYTDGTQALLTSQVTWTSATPAVATINASGLASAVATGSSAITATFGGVTSTAASLTVTAATLTSMQISAPGISIVQGTTQQYSAGGSYSDGSSSDITANVTWNSTSPSVAAFQPGGTVGDVTAGQAGATTITASLGVVASNQLALTVTPAATTITASVAALALSVTNTGLSPALTGNPRQITMTNTGAVAAINITASTSPALPIGTTLTSTCGATLVAGGSCVLTVTPGSTPSAAPGDTSPVAIVLTVQGSNTNVLNPAVYVLTYGSVYQSGFVFSVDDTTAASGSIGGKVAALVDQGTLAWTQGYDSVYGIDEVSTSSAAAPALPNPNTSGYAACNGAADGACNQGNLNLYYAGGSQASYAVEFCDPTLGGFSDWYLPAICELGYDTAGSGSSCGTSSSPGLQNIRSNLVDSAVPGTGLANGVYYASTEASFDPQPYAWLQYMAPGSPQTIVAKLAAFQVRCVRALTP
jgi:Bacterial Ig-like domain (group 2)